MSTPETLIQEIDRKGVEMRRKSQNVLMLEQIADAMLDDSGISEWPKSKRLDCVSRLNALAEMVADWEDPAAQRHEHPR